MTLDVIGASPASLGLTRRLKAIQYEDDLFIERRQPGYWHGHLQRDWVEHDYGPALACQSVTWLDLLDIHTCHPAAGNLKNEFTWSYSRAATYRKCPRAYYYHYYAAWEGWQVNAPAPVRQTYLLKNLTSVTRWVGDLVHETIKFALTQLRAGRPVPEDDLINQMHSRAQVDFADSHSGRYRQKPNQLTGFQEHYYRVDLSDTTWQAAWAEAEQYLRTFINSTLYAQLCRQPAATFLEIEALQSFIVADTKVWIQMDLVRHEGDSIYIYDWKTGSIDEEEIRQQLGIYGLYVQYAWPELTANTTLRGIVYALAENRLFEFDLDQTTLQEMQTIIKASIADLQSLLFDSRANLAELKQFPMIDDLSVCQQCQFRELCGRE